MSGRLVGRWLIFCPSLCACREIGYRRSFDIVARGWRRDFDARLGCDLYAWSNEPDPACQDGCYDCEEYGYEEGPERRETMEKEGVLTA